MANLVVMHYLGGSHKPQFVTTYNSVGRYIVQLFAPNLPAQLEDSKQNCLHCDTVSMRLGTFLVNHIYVLVGISCSCQSGKVAAIRCTEYFSSL